MPQIDSTFELPAEDELGRFIQSKDWEGAQSELDRRLEQTEEVGKRVFYYLFMGTVLRFKIRDALRAKDRELHEKLRLEIMEMYKKARETAPLNVTPRIKTAEYLIRYDRQPEPALEFLEPFAAEAIASKDDLMLQDHIRLALRGLALILLDQRESGLAELHEAYGAKFSEPIRWSYNLPFWIMARRKIALQPDEIDGLLEKLQAFKGVESRSVQILHKTLNEVRRAKEETDAGRA